jgi:hypothetical protein
VRAPQPLPQPPPHRRLSTASNAVLSNTTSFLRNLHNGAEVRCRREPRSLALPAGGGHGRSPSALCAEAPPRGCPHQIFVVGTAHVSKRSAEEVREMIRLVKPGTVLVELCPQRAARVRAGGAGDADFLQVWQ